jgi:outer membrane protein OmpA-like peptidoglycan-associated protein
MSVRRRDDTEHVSRARGGSSRVPVSYPWRVRWVCIAIIALAGVAAAQPVSYQLQGQVPVGQKPKLVVKAAQAVTDLRIELDRDDGKHFAMKWGVLSKGQSTTFELGDGKAGKSSFKGTIAAQVNGEKWSDQLSFDTAVTAPIKVTYDADHLDLDKHELQVKLNRPVDTAELVVFGEDGKEIGKGNATWTGEPADKWLAITWKQLPAVRVMTMKLRVAGNDGVASNVELIPWSVTIDHEDVNFATDSAVIAPAETAKLDASLAKIADAIKLSGKFMKMKLYVAGHTDTVGATAKNRKLSFDRAVAIGTYFKKKGVKIPIVVAGFGEEVLKVNTKDNVDEEKNRRSDYVLGPAAGTPPFKGPYLKVKADWKQLR